MLKPIIRDFRWSCGPACNALSKYMINNVYKSLVEKTTAEFDFMATEAIRSKLGEVRIFFLYIEKKNVLIIIVINFFIISLFVDLLAYYFSMGHPEN